MFGLDTLVLCENGFKTVGELTTDDLILNPLGAFSHIEEIIDVEEENAFVVSFSTNENVIVSPYTRLPVYNTRYRNEYEVIRRVKDLPGGKYATTKTLPIINTNETYKGYYYNVGVDMPYVITDEMLMLPWRDKTDLILGILDTPLVTLFNEDGVYEITPSSYEIEKGLVSLFRTFGYPVMCATEQNRRILRFGIQNLDVINDIQYKDRYKELSVKPPYNRHRFMPVNGVMQLNKKIPMRKIHVSGGFFLIGYSLIPFCSVK